MAGSSNAFPAFIRAEYDPSGNGFPAFQKAAETAAAGARKSFDSNLGEIQSIVSRALTMPKTASGQLDLGVGEMKLAATAAQQNAIALRELATAAQRTAASTGDTTQATRLYVAAANAAAIEAERGSRAAAGQVAVYSQLQANIAKSAAGQRALAQSTRGTTQGFAGLSQQAQDVAIQLQAGTNPLQVFVQQGGQAAFAAQSMGGAIGRIGTILSGGWGILIFGAAAAVSFFTRGMLDNKAASEAADKAASDFASHQGNLASFFDLATGALKEQNQTLIQNAILTRRATIDGLKKTAETSGKDAFKAARLARITDPSDEDRFASERGGGTVRAGIDPAIAAVVKRSGADAALLDRNLRALGKSRPDLKSTIVTVSDLAAKAALAGKKIGDIEKEVSSLVGGKLDPTLRTDKPLRGRKPRDNSTAIANLADVGAEARSSLASITSNFDLAPREIDKANSALAQLAKLADDLGEKNARSLKLTGKGLADYAALQQGVRDAEAAVNVGVSRQLADSFRETPTLAAKASAAIAQLDAQAEKLSRDRPSGFEKALEEVGASRGVIADALNRPMDELIKQQERQLAIQRLINAGREEEAAVLAIVNSQEDQGRKVLDDKRAALLGILQLARQEAEIAEEGRRRLQPYLSAVDELRGNLTRTIEGFPSRGLKSVSDFASGVRDSFNRLSTEVLVQDLFGSVFEDMKKFILGKDGPATPEARLAKSMNTGSVAIETFAANVTEVANSMARLPAILAAANPATAVASSATTAIASAIPASIVSQLTTFLSPIAGAITSAFGQRRAPVPGASTFHKGIDLAARTGTSVRAPAGGLISRRGSGGALGNFLDIDHGSGTTSRYAHLSRNDIRNVGSRVAAGDVIGKTGATGRVSGPHLHYQVFRNGKPVDPVNGKFPVDIAVDAAAGGGIAALGEAATLAASQLAAAGQAVVDSANDEIVVTGKRLPKITPEGIFNRTFQKLLERVGVSGDLAKRVGQLGTVIKGAGIGAAAGSTASSVLGYKNSTLGSSVGGAIGNVAGKLLEKGVTKVLGKTLGQFAGPGGAIIGGLVGGALGGLLTKTKKGSASIGIDSQGNLKVGSATGNSGAFKKASTEAADGAITTVQRIAEALGGSLGSDGAVSIGVRKGSYKVDTTGRGRTKGSGVLDFGEDGAAAVRAATLDLIRDGVIKGLRGSTQALLQSAKDIDSGLEKALRFENVFKELRRRTDPVGAALADLGTEFDSLRRLFAEAGASAAELTDLEKLYGLRRADAIKEATEQATGALRSLLDDLKLNNDALSLRDRLSLASAAYNPLAADVRAGKSVDNDAFAAAARNVNDLMRQIEGSNGAYFAFLDDVTALTTGALSQQQAMIAAATGTTPLDGPSAPSSANDNAPVVDALGRLGDQITDSLGTRLDTLNGNVVRMLTRGVSGGGSGGGSDAMFLSNIQNF